MARSSVPKFGNWEDENNVPYTVYFEKARKNRGGTVINPNDPQQNLDMFPNNDPPIKPKTRPDEPTRRGVVRPMTPEHREGGFRQSINSSTRSEIINHSNYSGRVERHARPAWPNGESEQGLQRSPLHPQYNQVRVSGSPSWEGRNYDSGHGNNGTRSRLRPARGDESPDHGKGAAVPKFGEWNEKDSQLAENFTHIFNKVRNERKTGIGNPSATPNRPSYNTYNRPSDKPKKCCFRWW